MSHFGWNRYGPVKIWRITVGSVGWKYDGEPELVSLWESFGDAWTAFCNYVNETGGATRMDDGLETETEHYTAWDCTDYVSLDTVWINTDSLYGDE